MDIVVQCTHCGKDVKKSTGHYNRSVKLGLRFYCDRKCRGLFKQTTVEDKKAVKAAYDKQNILKPEIKAKRKGYNETPSGRVAQKRRRQTRMPKHVEYCRQPEYKEKKIEYDREHRAKKLYGEFWEAAILSEQIEAEITKKADKQNLRTIQGTNNKSKRRKKQWLRLLKNLPQLT